MSDTPPPIDSLSPEEKRAFLTELLRKKANEPQTAPVSFGQQRLWFLDQLEPGNPVYNESGALRLLGTLDVTALEQVFNEVVRRHEVLRTTFVAVDGEPVQVIAPSLRLTLPVVDLGDLPESERDPQVRRLAGDEAERPFDLARGPLLRIRLLRLDEQDHVLVMTLHHIICDGWSVGVLIREVAALYKAFQGGRPSPLPELPIQYADYARWQRQWLQGEALQKQLSYWKQQLQGAPPALNLPTDRPRPARQTYHGATQSMLLTPSLTEALKEMSRREGVTLFMTLLAGFKCLLSRYTGEDDIVVGSPIAGRTRAEMEGLIGFFVNTLVLRTNLSGDPSFREVLARVREGTLAAYAHQDLPFEKLVEELQPERDMTRTPIFQVMFALQNTPRPMLELPGVRGSRLEIDTGTTKFDVVLSMLEEEEGLSGCVTYNTDLFNGGTITRMLQHFQNLLEGVVANPVRRLSSLPLLTETERIRILSDWNETGTAYPQDSCIHQMFESQAERTPDAVAVVLEGEQMTYRELNTRSNQLARYLQKQGVEPEVRVGIYMEPSLEMVIGLLGILKAGGAYVPLDPTYPSERLAFMLEDSQAPLLLTQEPLRDPSSCGHARPGRIQTSEFTPSPLSSFKLICLDSEREAIDQESEDPVGGVTPDSLAYVIYTSGSTGKPKGVLVSHANVIRLFQATQSCFHFDQSDVWSLFHSYAFDFSVWELWGALFYGGRLVVVPYWIRRSPEAFYDLLCTERVTVLNQTPSAFRQLMREEAEVKDGAKDLALRLVIFGGEALDLQGLKPWFDRRGDQSPQLVNMYGITETTVHVTYRPLTRADLGKAPASPIGRPLPDLQVYILDQQLRPVPVGVPGELCVGGDGLARGYLNRPELTAEKFIPNPFGGEPRTRLYKSGDLARYLPDGEIEYLGRVDHQLKVRGFRIEPGEIEAVLGQHPSVRETVVLARGDGSGDKRLVAYLVTTGEAALSISELRRFLSEKLPEHMIPSAFVMLNALPLTPNGKVDRRALPAPDRSRPQVDGAFTAPRTLTEEVLAGIWGQVLGIERVGIHDNFFELGGHSLLATQLVFRLREAFQVDLSLRCFFESPTVAELAGRVEAVTGDTQGPSTPPLRPLPRDGSLPLSFGQEGVWFIEQLQPGTPFNIPIAIHLTGRLNPHVLDQCFTEILRRHEALRTSFAVTEDRPVQVIAPSLTLNLPVVDLSKLPVSEQEVEVRQRLLKEAQRPFDLTHGPLLRATLLRLGEEEHVVLIIMHHIVSDGWSVGVLTRELSMLYEAFSTGRPSPLPHLPIQYADFAGWQRQCLEDGALEDSLAYWKQRLGGRLPILELPTDRPRPAIQTFRGAIQSLALPATLSASLNALSRREAVTPFMTLLAAFQILLLRYTGQDDIIVGSPFAGRTRAETEGLIGLFVNLLPLRLDLSGDPRFEELLGRVREVMLEAYAHQDVPFEKLVESLQLERQPSRTPLFQVTFMLQDNLKENFQLPGSTLSSLATDIGGLTTDIVPAIHDLTMYIVDAGEEFTVAVHYRTDLFDAATISRLLGHYRTLLEGIVADPRQRLSSLPTLTQEERRRLLVEWNDTKADGPHELCTHQLFEAQAQRRPDALAVIYDDEHLTYRELNCQANQVAHYLQRLGVGPEVPVGILMERSLEMVIGLLGILKAGGAYVPLDPSYPQERLAFMLEDAQVPVLLTQERLRDTIQSLNPDPQTSGRPPSCPVPRVVCLDSEWKAIARQNGDQPVSGVTVNNAAYVIYTSGSTGSPKGVLVPHRAVVNHNLATARRFELQPEDRVLQFHSLSFDGAVEELFPSWLSGATVVLRTTGMVAPGEEFLRLIEREKLTVLNLPTAYWHGWVSELCRSDAELPTCLRLVIVGGEKVSAERFSSWQKRGRADLRWINTYGPTEATVIATLYEPPPDGKDGFANPKVLIGRPIANTQVYLLDSHLHPVPIGVAGELHIGGRGLARGYLNRPGITAEKFIPNPFGEEPGSRLYKTGDLARYRPDGNIEFLGRLDQQVKLRGFRVEPGEIEAMLNQHSDVRQAVVLAREDAPGDKRLVAYFVPAREAAPTNSDLRRFLKARLPEYMLPSAFVMLDSFPLTANGKLDRQALPTPDRLRPRMEQVFEAPRTTTEREIAEIWARALKVEQVGIHDDFFELGGHSLLATQLISRMREALEVDLPLRSLFEAPTVAGIAQSIEVARRMGPKVISPRRPASNERDHGLGLFETKTVTELNADAVLDPAFHVEAALAADATKPTSVLLTGATGYLGAFLLHELLHRTEADIYCLVRSPHAAGAKKRLQDNLKFYSLWDDRVDSRIIPVPGDLSQAYLGLSAERFQVMARQLDVIYHNGALVSFMYPYRVHKAPNVLGTQEVLRLASQIKPKPVHFVSTISVFRVDGNNGHRLFRETDNLDEIGVPYGGYAQSKWVAEKLVRMAGSRGLPVCIYRPGLVAGHSQTGAWNREDLASKIMRICIQLGSVPELDLKVNLVPVDFVSQAIVHLSQQSESLGKVFHLVNPQPADASELIDWLGSSGYPLRPMPYDNWRATLLHLSGQLQQNDWTSLLELIKEVEPDQIQVPQIECQNTLAGLTGSSIVCPPVGPELLGTYLSYFIRDGLLDAPPPNEGVSSFS